MIGEWGSRRKSNLHTILATLSLSSGGDHGAWACGIAMFWRGAAAPRLLCGCREASRQSKTQGLEVSQAVGRMYRILCNKGKDDDKIR